ncbi:MAG: tRNA adenosine(34) deaminase TadA [Clostridia bacterium]
MMDIKFMRKALALAEKAFALNEVPVGAVIVQNGKVIASGYNTRQHSKDATSHAEIVAIRKACKKFDDWRLEGCDIYVTVEPCPMCAGACINARIENIYYGAYEQYGGSCGTVFDIPSNEHLCHRANTQGGIMEEECVALIKEYFKKKREENKAKKEEKND